MFNRTHKRIKALSAISFWKHRGKRIRKKSIRNYRRVLHKRKLASFKRGVVETFGLLAKSLELTSISMLVLFLIELLVNVLRSNLNSEIPVLLKPVSNNDLMTLISIVTAVAAALLGLHYTIVGVVVSASYQDAPRNIRNLLIENKNSRRYTWILISTLTSGLVILILGFLKYDVSLLTIVIFVTLALVGVCWLVILGNKLFDFFNPAVLLEMVPARIVEEISVVATGELGRREYFETLEHNAHDKVVQYFEMYRYLLERRKASDSLTANDSLGIIRALFGIERLYTYQKAAIPTKSGWWGVRPKYLNWLTMDSLHLHPVVDMYTGYPPQEIPDYLWFEDEISGLLELATNNAIQAKRYADTLSLANYSANMIRELAGRFQIDEALVIEQVWAKVIPQMHESARSGILIDASSSQNRLAAAESLVIPLTDLFLGLVDVAQIVTKNDWKNTFERCMKESSKNTGPLPTRVRRQMEYFTSAINEEKRLEGREITPEWWVNHFLAKELLFYLLDSWEKIYNLVDYRVASLMEYSAEEEADVAATIGISLLELLQKIDVNEPLIENASQALQNYKSGVAGDSEWPKRRFQIGEMKEKWAKLLIKVISYLPRLRSDHSNSDVPDLYGQIWQFGINAVFTMAFEQDPRIIDLFELLFREVDSVQRRISEDFADGNLEIKILHTTEPLVTLMELSGYVYLFSEINDSMKPAWKGIKQFWLQSMERKPKLFNYLLQIAMMLDHSLRAGTGGLERSSRKIRLKRYFEDLGFPKKVKLFYPFDGSGEKRPHRSPIVSAFIDDFLGTSYDLYNLLILGLDSSNQESLLIPDSGAKELSERIEYFRSLSREE